MGLEKFRLATMFAAIAITSGSASAGVLDAAYQGTVECGTLPFTKTKTRDPIRVTNFFGKIKYVRVVRLGDSPETIAETGNGQLDGQNIRLEGSWRGGRRAYNAVYVGTFVRRAAKLTGTQTWTLDGDVAVRTCTGFIRRPFRFFIRRPKSDAA
jgi:hypothetical protein